MGGKAGAGSLGWKWWGRLIGDFGEKLAADGLMSADDVLALKKDWAAAARQPDAFIYTPILLQVVARKA